jgi:transposase InsO family protein
MARKVIAMNVKMLVATLPDDANLSEWCRRLGLSRPTAYKVRARYRAEGFTGLEERSRAPKRPFGRIDPALEDAVVATRKQLADEGFDHGPASVQSRLAAQGMVPPSEATIWRIGVRRGQISPQPRKRPRVSYRRFQRERPNECWQGDDTHYVLGTGQEVRIINILDDHSRLNVDSLAAISARSEHVWECFCRGAARCGLPAEFLNDNGRAYYSALGYAPVAFQAHLARLGVRQLHSSPYHPQTCGKVERFHQTQRRWLNAQPVANTVAELQALLDRFRVLYNESRPHRALGRRTPAQVWSSQPPAAPVTTSGPATVHVVTNQADSNGTVRMGQRHTIGLGVPWAHCHVTIIRRGDEVTIIDTTTAEVVRQLTIDPTRRYQPTGKSRGNRNQPRRHV